MDNNKLGTMKPLPLVLSMALPVMLSMALQAIYNIADSLFIARYSEASFAAVSIIQPMLMIFTSLANGIAAGEGSLLSKCLGADDDKRARSSVGTAWSMAAISSVAAIVIIFLFVRPFVGFFLHDDPSGQDAIIYLKIVALGLPFFFASSLITFILQSHGHSKSAMFIQGSGAICNIIFDPVLIFTMNLGTAGAALATTLGYILSFAVAAVLYFPSDSTMSKFSLKKKDCRRITQVAMPSMMVQAAGPIVGIILNKLVVSYGVNVMAVFGMYQKTESFMFLAAGGIASALIVIVGYNYGRGDMKRVKKCFFTSLSLSWSIMIIGFFLFQAFTTELVSLFTDSPEVIEIGVRAFKLLCFCFLLTAPNIITSGLLQGLGMGKQSLIITYSRFFLFLLPFAFILNHFFGITGVWLSFFAADIPTLFLIFFLYRKVCRDVLDKPEAAIEG